MSFMLAESSCLDDAASEDWGAIKPRLLPAVVEWLEGPHAPNDVQSLIFSSEPVCAGLNLYRFLLLRERGGSSEPIGVRPSGFLHKCGILSAEQL